MDTASDLMDDHLIPAWRKARGDGYQYALPTMDATREEIVAVLGAAPGGLTAEEVHDRLPHRTLNNVRSRLTDLKKCGRVETTGRRPSARTGVRISVFQMAPQY